MIVSANELEALVTKAARGAGWPPALAAEAGRATVWLCEIGKDGCAAALDALATKPRKTAPHKNSENGTFQDVHVIAAGPSVLDLLAIDPNAQIVIPDTSLLPLLLGYAGVAARGYDMAVQLAVRDKAYTVTRAGVTETPSASPGEQIVITQTSDPTPPITSNKTVIEVDPDHWSRMTQLAMRSYVPSSEASRAKGAGAGLTDND